MMKKGKLLALFLTVSLIFACKEVKKSGNELEAAPAYGENLSTAPDANTDAEIKIVPIEHATAVVEWENITIYIDPTGGAAAFEGFKQPDLILITDIHGDHFNLETLEALNLAKAKIVVPQAVADKFPSTLSSQLEVLNNGAKTEIHSITIEAIPMYNLREEALQFHEKGRGNGYVLTIGEERLYFSGDTEDIAEMRALKNIDKAFICMNLPYTMTVESAADAVLEFQPKQVYPYHFRGNPEVGNVVKFKELVNKGNSEIEVVQLDWYPKEDY
jgi:L-ascorbate metabolism protein UlaG (beta-lactamase superfamily)